MKKLLATLFSVLLVLNVLAPAAFAEDEATEGEESTSTAAVTAGTADENGVLQFEFETLAENAGDTTNILSDVGPNGDNGRTKGADGIVYASGNALWANIGTKVDPTATFNFTSDKTGYYKVYYAVGNYSGNTTDLSKVTLTVNGTVVGDNHENNTKEKDLTQYDENNAKIYPWRYEGMMLYCGSATCYLDGAGSNTLTVSVDISGGNQKLYKFFADYIKFVPISATSVSTGDYLTQLVPELSLTLVSNIPVSFDFSVPRDGNYAFYANRNTNYANGTVTVSVKNKADGSLVQACTAETWDAAGSGAKPYGRMGGTAALKAGVDYVLEVTSSAGFTTSYFDVIRTDIDVDEKIIIPTHYYTSTDQTNEHFKNNCDYKVGSETIIPQNFADYTVIGSPKSALLKHTENYSPITTLISKNGGYLEYTLNIPEDGFYAFGVNARVYSGSNVATPEPLYFLIDDEEKGSSMYNPRSYADALQYVEFQTELTAGAHKLKVLRKMLTGENASEQNTYMYITFLTAERSVPTAAMYLGSVADGNEISLVQSGDLLARIETNGTVTTGEDVLAFFAIYDSDKQMVAVDSSIGALTDSYIDLKIENFRTEDGKKYKAKAFLWNDKLQGTCFELAEMLELSELPDFSVTVPEGREPVVLQLTDPQIIDASQERTASRLGGDLDTYYAKDQADARCYNYMKETIEATSPDLILLTGDLVYGEFDDDGSAFTKLVEFMDSFEIPWAPIFGNHDNESTKGADWQCALLENAEHCLFKQRSLTGNGNYTVGLWQGGELKRMFYMLDSNGCRAMSNESYANGHSQKAIGFGADQIKWFTDVDKKLDVLSPDTKVSFAFHIPLAKFRDAYAKYGFVNDDTFTAIDIDTHASKADTDFGYLGGKINSVCDTDGSAYEAMKQAGADSLFVGHLHEQSASVVYDGVRFQFGQKASTYDQTNYKTKSGDIQFSYVNAGAPIVGGTVMKLSQQTGDIKTAYIYYCDTSAE